MSRPASASPSLRRPRLAVVGLVLLLGPGCAAITNPVADGIPVRRLPPEALGESRNDVRPVPLASLVVPAPPAYTLAAGDTLGVFAPGALGRLEDTPPVTVVSGPDGSSRPPAIGYPVLVRENGTIALPQLDPLLVAGKTLTEAEEAIKAAYARNAAGEEVLKPDQRARIIVTLLRPRLYHILVLREDAGGVTFGTSGGFGVGGGNGSFYSQTRKTAGFPLDLPAGENTLLNALTRSGGLPGGEAEDYVLIQRKAYRPGPDGKPAAPPALDPSKPTLRVPLRLRPGEPFPVRPDDLVLQDGDVVSVETRSGELFYTGGLLPPRAFPLPFDRDLDILEAIALVGGPILNGGLAANNLSGQIVQTGLGFPSPSQVTIVRRTKTGAQIPILVSLNRAVKDPRERIAVRPGDFLILQQTAGEGLAQYVTTNFRLGFNGVFARQRDFLGTAAYTAP